MAPSPMASILQTVKTHSKFQDLEDTTELSWFYGSGILIGWALLSISCIIKDLRRRPYCEYLGLEDILEDDISTGSRREGKLSWRTIVHNLDHAIALLYPLLASIQLTILEVVQGPGWKKERQNAYLVLKPIDVIWGRVWIFWIFYIGTELFWDDIVPNFDVLKKIGQLRDREARWRKRASTLLFRISVFGLFFTTIFTRISHLQRFVLHYIDWQIDPIIIDWGHLTIYGPLLQANFLALIFVAFILPFWTAVDIIVQLLKCSSHTDTDSPSDSNNTRSSFKVLAKTLFRTFFGRLDFWGYYILGSSIFLFCNSLVLSLWQGIHRLAVQDGTEPDIRPAPSTPSLFRLDQGIFVCIGAFMLIIRIMCAYRSYRVPWTLPLPLVTRKSSFRV